MGCWCHGQQLHPLHHSSSLPFIFFSLPFLLFSFFKRLSHLLERVTKRGVLVANSLPKWPSSQGWARLKLAVWSFFWFSHVGIGAQTWTIFCCSSWSINFQKAGLQMEQLGHELVLMWGCWHLRCQPYPLYHNATTTILNVWGGVIDLYANHI